MTLALADRGTHAGSCTAANGPHEPGGAFWTNRDIGYALVRAAGAEAPDLVVFAEPGDMTLLGAHSLEGLNLRVDPVGKALVPAGPVIAAIAA